MSKHLSFCREPGGYGRGWEIVIWVWKSDEGCQEAFNTKAVLKKD